jgi:hypothetical protein
MWLSSIVAHIAGVIQANVIIICNTFAAVESPSMVNNTPVVTIFTTNAKIMSEFPKRTRFAVTERYEQPGLRLSYKPNAAAMATMISELQVMIAAMVMAEDGMYVYIRKTQK